MDYEKKYNEAIKRAKQHCADYVVETIFPELKESEDERIRKAIVELVHDTTGDSLWVDYGVHKEDALAWLEKQGEHAAFRKGIQVGDQVTRNEDGVLFNLSQLKRVAKQGEQKQDISIQINPSEYTNDMGGNGCYLKNTTQKPADKVEPKKEDTSELTPFEAELFSMMSDAWQGYQLGEEVNIAEIVKEHSSELLERANKQNPAWSEEDIVAIDCAVEVLNKDLPSLAASIERLKSLRPQNTWKPSDEQMEAMQKALFDLCGKDEHNIITGLYYDLKKLREK